MNILTVTLKTTGAMTIAAMLLLSAACGGERKTERKAGETKTAETAASVDTANVETETQTQAEEFVTEASGDENPVPPNIEPANRERFIGRWQTGTTPPYLIKEFTADGNYSSTCVGCETNDFDGDIVGGPWKVENNRAVVTIYLDGEDLTTDYFFVEGKLHEGPYPHLGRPHLSEADVQAATPGAGTFIDPRDNQTYRTVRIGNLTWFAQNLNYQTNDSWCYDNDNSNCDKYGRLYTWDAAMKACPDGWRLSSYDDWENLFTIIDLDNVALKTTTGWDGGVNGTNSLGFSALPGGSGREGTFEAIGYYGYWWGPHTHNFDEGLGTDGFSVPYISMHGSNQDLYTIGNDGFSQFSIRCVTD